MRDAIPVTEPAPTVRIGVARLREVRRALRAGAHVFDRFDGRGPGLLHEVRDGARSHTRFRILPRTVDARDDDVGARLVQRAREVAREQARARVEVGLKHDDEASGLAVPRGREERGNLRGVMRVVVHDPDTPRLSPQLVAPPGARERRHRRRRLAAGRPPPPRPPPMPRRR